MNEKRISLRFQADNKLDMKAWELLEKAANEKKASKNSIMIELIISAFENVNSDVALAEEIAELVVAKLGGVTNMVPKRCHLREKRQGIAKGR